MFRTRIENPVRRLGPVIAGLLAFSVAALGVTIWVMVDFLREQVIVAQLLEQLPPESTESAVELAGELRWQFRLSILVVLNLLATSLALVLLSRAYRASQESLRDVKALAADILSSVDQAVMTTNLKGQITTINRRGLELFGVDSHVIGQSLDELAPTLHLQQFRKVASEQGTTRLVRDFEFSPPSSNHHPRRLRVFCDPLRNYNDREIGSIIQIRDVTERSLIEDRMHRMERFLELGSLAVGLHHEIKNPLAALSLHVQLLEEELQGQDDLTHSAEVLAVVRHEVSRISNVLESFRDFASLRQLQLSEVDILEMVYRQVRLVAPRARQSGVTISVSAEERSSPLIRADAVKIEQVLLNLIMNAIEAMPYGGQVKIRVLWLEEADSKQIVIEIEDNGPGIPEDFQQRIFAPYFTTKGDGTGMGLAISEKIIRQHEGSLQFTTSAEGTVFNITLPMAVPDSELKINHE